MRPPFCGERPHAVLFPMNGGLLVLATLALRERKPQRVAFRQRHLELRLRAPIALTA